MKLGKLCAVIFSGGTPNTSNTEYWNGEFHWLSSGETRNTYIFNTEKTITQKGVDNSSTRLAKENDVVIASAGQGKTRGQVSYCMIDTYINQSLISMRTNPKLLDPKFLFYNLTSRYNELRTLSDSSSSRGSLTIPILENIDILLPPLKQQKTIATILSNYDDLIDNNNKRIKILEEMAQKIYKEWFIDFKYPGHETATFKDTELGKIPSDWKVGKIETYYSTSSGGTPSRKQYSYYEGGTINWVKTGELKNTFIVDTEEKITDLAIKKSSTKLFPENTVVLAMYCGMGDLSIMSKPMATNQACCVFLPKYDYLDYSFTYLFFNGIIKEMTNLSFGAAQQNLSQEIIKGYMVKFPNKELVIDFSSVVSPIFMQIKDLLYKNKILKQTRDLLLPRLLSGEIDVEKLELV